MAVDRGARLARIHGEHVLAQRWEAEARTIHEAICKEGVDATGKFTQTFRGNALDASLLLLPLVRFLPADDPRIRNTVLAVANDLTEHGLVLRYRLEDAEDGVGGREATFTICSFWLVSALVAIGEVDKARDLCEKLLSFSSPLGLYSEELEAKTGRHLGNFPQAFTHLGLINALMHVIRAENDEPADRLVIARLR